MFQLPFTPGATIPSTFFRGVISTTRCFYAAMITVSLIYHLAATKSQHLCSLLALDSAMPIAEHDSGFPGEEEERIVCFCRENKISLPPLISAPTLWFSQCLYCVPTANFAPKCKNQQSFNGFSKSVVKPHFANICSAIFSWFPNRHEELAFSTPVQYVCNGGVNRGQGMGPKEAGDMARYQ